MIRVSVKLPKNFLRRWRPWRRLTRKKKQSPARVYPPDCLFPIPPHYSFALNFGCTNLILVVSILVLWQLLAPGGQELWLIPCVILLANLAEYGLHRWPMHHRCSGLLYLFQAHTLSHHRFFSEGGQAIRNSREAYKVVLSIPNVAGLLAVFAALFGTLWMLAGQNAAALVTMTLLVYFATYEWLHLLFHAPARFRVHAWPAFGRLQRLHRAARRRPCNFNITFPLGDVLFRTLDPVHGGYKSPACAPLE